MKCIVIDESYDSIPGKNGRFFVLAALKTDNQEILEKAIKEVRSKIYEYNNNCNKGKKKIKLQEIHEHEVHGKYPNVKKWSLEKIFCSGKNVEIYVAWFDMDEVIFKNDVERYKIAAKELLILCGVKDVEIIHFDIFLDNFKSEKPNQQEKIKSFLRNELKLPKLNIQFKNSQEFRPLQAVDIVAGTYRRNLHREDNFNYKKIRPHVKGELRIKNK